jgi:hypothetical protein
VGRDPVAPRSGRRRRRILRAFVGILAFVAMVLSCIEIAYQIELLRLGVHTSSLLTSRRSLPPLLVKSAAVYWLDTANPQMRPTYPWTAVAAIARTLLGERPRLTPEDLAVHGMSRDDPYLRGSPFWSGVEDAVLATWISRHFSASEAISEALSSMRFGDTWGIEQAARRYFGKSAEDLDAEETADLLTLDQWLKHPEEFRLRRDHLLRNFHAHGVIDEPTMLAGMKRDVRRIK